jgi:hypothetical protein
VRWVSISFLTTRHSTVALLLAKQCSRSSAELERNTIRERVLAGMEHARPNGTKSGKAVGRPKAVIDRDEVVRLRHESLSWREIGRKLRVGSATVRRVYKEWQAAQAALNGDADSPELQATTVVDRSPLIQ